MCGIAGILSFSPEGVDGSAIKKMTNAMVHRGPDADGFYVDDRVALGHRRLSIIDLSTAANQPFHDSTNRYVIVFNGELYNYAEIKSQLLDYHFSTTSDTEVLLAAYIKWGAACLDKLKGMFAFAIWDKAEQVLFLARDRMGVKPLYFFKNENDFVFGSEIRAIMATGIVPKVLNQAAIVEFFTYQSIGYPYSIIEGVKQLEAGSWMRIKSGEIEEKKYWKLTAVRTEHDFSDGIAVQRKIRDLLTASVEKRLVSDVPVGAFLSGGIDSSAIVGLMAEVSSTPANTFNISFSEKEFDEARYANLVAKKFNTNHTTITLTPNVFLDELENGLNAMDTPSADGLNTYIVSKAIKDAGITVALSGIGGDELFAGYPIFEQYRQLQSKQNLFSGTSWLRWLAGNFIVGENSRKERLRQIINSPKPSIENLYPVLREILTPELLSAMTRLPETDILSTRLAKNLYDKKDELAMLPIYSQVSAAEYMGYTQQTLLKDTDQMSMAVSLEVREPFFDHDLVEYVLAIPDILKKPTYPKSLLVESLKPLLPDEIVHRKKQGFVFPWESWMKNELKKFCAYHIRGMASRSFIKAEPLLYYWNRFLMDDKTVRWTEVWMFVILNHWLEKNGL